MTTGVLVMAYGTPSSADGVEAYYTRIRHGRAPSAEQLADLRRRYNAIGGTSPLTVRTNAQVAALDELLAKRAPGSYRVRYGSKYESPMIEEAARSLVADRVTSVVGVVLAPHESSMSTQQYFERAAKAVGVDTKFHGVGAWWDEPKFLDLIAQRVRSAVATVPVAQHDSTEVIFSAHSLPQRILDSGDSYPDQLRESARRAADLAGITRWDIAWQSAGRTEEPWLGPDILEVLRTKRAAGVTNVVSCPIGFVADHLEVLYDLDIEARSVASEIGLGFVRTDSLNDDPQFISLLGDLVQRAR